MMFKLRPVLIASIFYLFITILFNYSFLCNGLFNCSNSHPSDGLSIEYITETSMQKLLHLENPFSFDQKLFYPFYTTYAMADPGISHILIYALFRIFLASHNALLLVVFVNLFLNYLVMFALLRKLKMEWWVALLGGFVFGAMPFVSYRVLNHYTYTPLFLFPLVFLLFYSLFEEITNKKKIIYSALLGVVGVYVLMNSFYYFVSICIAVGAIGMYSLVFHRSVLFNAVRQNSGYLFVSGITFLLLIIPWLVSVATLAKLFTKSDMVGFGGAWLLSSDLLNVFLPSQYNPLYNFLFSRFSNIHAVTQKVYTMYLSGYSKNAYAGIVLLASFIGTIIFRKKLPKQSQSSAMMFMVIALFFLLLSFGPFLQIVNRWFVMIEGVMVVLPMPFLVLHYLPGMETLRAPSRFIPMYVFFLVLTSAYLWNYLYRKLPQDRLKYGVIGAIFMIVFLDQMYIIPKPAAEYTTHIPTKLYEKIGRDTEQSTVLEIPFTLRDGFEYRGDVKAIVPMQGALIHHKPIIGGYIARVPTEIFSYYDRLPFISYLGSTIDVGNAADGSPIKKEIKPFVGPSNEVVNEINFLNVKYILLKNDESYSRVLRNLVTSAAFKKVSTDSNYELYARPLTKKEFTKIDFTKGQIPAYQLGTVDRDAKKSGFQFSSFAKVFFNTKKIKKNLMVKALTNKAAMADIYINSHYIETISFSKKQSTMSIHMNQLTPGDLMVDIVLKDSSADSQATLYTVEVK